MFFKITISLLSEQCSKEIIKCCKTHMFWVHQKKSALASGVRPCSGTHTPGSALRAGATRRSPTQCVVAIEGASLRSALYTATREWFARRILFLRSKCWCYLNSSTRSKAMFVLRVGTIQVSLDNRLFQV